VNPRRSASGEQRQPPEPASTPEPQPDGIAVSPLLGPLPAIYVPQSPGAGPGAGIGAALWDATVRYLSGLGARIEHIPRGEAMTGIPSDLRYSSDHLWARVLADGCTVRVGVTDFAQQSLGDVVEVTPPRLGETVQAGEPCGEIESTKSVNDLVAPVTGTVRARHDDLEDSPDLVNTDPYGEGWIFEIETDPASLDKQLAALIDPRAYSEMVGG
jgi:glycine cleavage system H protein